MQSTALAIVQKLQAAGYTAYYAGGAVRDIILKHEPEDIDIATNAKPEEIEALFAKTYSIGKNFGVILVQEEGHHFEIATFRSDAGYTDGRRPDAVLFTTAEEDALRRDFTINGMFYDPITKEIHDFVGGQADLKNKILRFIDDPEQRIQEDYLRILRAIRFKNRFGLTFDTASQKALEKHNSLIIGVSAERVREELSKMLVHPHRKKTFEDLVNFGILEHIIPEFTFLEGVPQPQNYHSEGNVLIHSLLVISELSAMPSVELAWAALFHDIGKGPTLSYEGERIRFPCHAEEGEKVAKKILTRLKFSKFSSSKICWLIRHHHIFDQFAEMKHTTKLRYFDEPFFEDLLLLHRADVFGCIPLSPDVHHLREKDLAQVQQEYETAHFENLLPSGNPELLTGAEIMKLLKIAPGKEIGVLKEELRDAQLRKEVSTKAEAEDWIRKFYNARS